MAKIFKTNEQEEALKTINADIKRISVLNRFINEKGEKVTFTAVTGSAKAFFSVEKGIIGQIAEDERKTLIKETRTLSKKYAIALDEDDEAVLGNKEEVKEVKEEKPEETPGEGNGSFAEEEY